MYHLTTNRHFHKPELGRNACEYDDMHYCKSENCMGFQILSNTNHYQVPKVGAQTKHFVLGTAPNCIYSLAWALCHIVCTGMPAFKTYVLAAYQTDKPQCH